MKKLTVQIIIHLAAWSCFLLLPFLFYPRPKDMDWTFFRERYLTGYFLVNNGFLIIFYYLNTYQFLPRLLDKKKFLAYTGLILGLLVFYCMLPRIYHSLFPTNNPALAIQQQGRPGPPRVRPLVNPFNLAVFLMVFVFSTGIRVINQWLRSD